MSQRRMMGGMLWFMMSECQVEKGQTREFQLWTW